MWFAFFIVPNYLMFDCLIHMFYCNLHCVFKRLANDKETIIKCSNFLG